LNWIQDGASLPTTVRDANFNPGRLLTLRTRNSAAYKGIYALLMQRGGREFLTDVPISFQTYEEEKIDIHHHLSAAVVQAKRDRAEAHGLYCQ
jgi:hypothetical protein